MWEGLNKMLMKGITKMTTRTLITDDGADNVELQTPYVGLRITHSFRLAEAKKGEMRRQ